MNQIEKGHKRKSVQIKMKAERSELTKDKQIFLVLFAQLNDANVYFR